MSRRLVQAGADTPDTHCSNCGCGLFEGPLPIEQAAAKFPYPTALETDVSYDLCRTCFDLEAALIHQSAKKVHPLRLAHYARMQERFS